MRADDDAPGEPSVAGCGSCENGVVFLAYRPGVAKRIGATHGFTSPTTWWWVTLDVPSIR